MPRPRKPVVDITTLTPLQPGKRNRRGEGGGKPKKWTEALIREFGDRMLEWFTEDMHPDAEGRVQIKRFFLKDFAIKEGVPSTYFRKFADASPYFAELYARCLDIEESKLLKYGFAGNAPGMVQYVLAKRHGYGWNNGQSAAQSPEETPQTPKQVFIIGGQKVEF
ncbi:MAG TPA: hypothetical protein PK916_04775 [Bacteroidota bacterium]|nr:hypothetical protein [Bacteroidota bacterium]